MYCRRGRQILPNAVIRQLDGKYFVNKPIARWPAAFLLQIASDHLF
jgi:hypothetical protein